MANSLGDMVVRIVGDSSQLDSSIDSSRTKITQFGTSAVAVGRNLSIALTAPIVAMGTAALKSAGKIQLYTTSFETLLGSLPKANALLSEMQSYADITPFNLVNIADAGKLLLQFGIAGTDVMGILKTIGDISQGSNERFQSLALAFGQCTSAGRLLGQDLLQMINGGFNPLQQISKETGKSLETLRDEMHKGAISSDMVAEAFKHAAEEGGMFFNGLERASKTLPGLTSTLQDDIASLGRSFVADLMPKLSEIIKGLSEAARWITDLDSSTKTFIVSMALFAAACGPIVFGIGKISQALTFLQASPVALTITALTTLVAALYSANAAIENSKLKELSNTYSEFSNRTGIASDEIKEILESFTALVNDGNITVSEATRQVAQAFGVSSAAVAEAVIMQGNLNDEWEKSLQVIIDQANEEKKLNLLSKAGKEDKVAGVKTLREQNAALAAEEAKAAAEKKKTDEKLKEDRLKAATTYADTIKQTAVSESLGLMTSKEAYDANISAMQKYADTLIKLGYDGKALNGVWTLGDAALAKIRVDLEKYNATMQESANVVNTFRAEEEEAAANAQMLAKINKARLDKQEADEKEYEANRKSAMSDIVTNIGSFLTAISDMYQYEADTRVAVIEEALAAELAALEVTQKAEADALEAAQEAELDALEEQQEAKLELMEEEHDAEKELLDAQLQEKLYSLGLVGAETAAQLELELAKAIATGDEETIAAARDALKKAQIEEEYAAKQKALEKQQAAEELALKAEQDKATLALETKQKADELALETAQDAKVAALEEAAAAKTAEIAYNANMATWRIQLAMTAAAGARAAIESYVNAGGWPWGAAAAASMAAVTAAEVALIAKQQPQLAEGGIVTPTNGGRSVTVAEAGEAEAIIPLSKLDSILERAGTTITGAAEQIIHLVANLEGKPFLDMIFPATKNHTVLISQGAVV